MAFGMELYASDGTLQASSELICYFCRKSGTVTTTAGTGLGGTPPTSKFSVPIAGAGYTNPIVAVVVAGYPVARFYNDGSGNPQYGTSAPVGTTATYYIFDYAAALPSSSFGIELYNASSQRTFSSNYFPLQVLQILTPTVPSFANAPVGTWEGSDVTFTGKSLAAGLPELGGFGIAGVLDYYLTSNPIIHSLGVFDFDQTGYQKSGQLTGAKITNTNQTLRWSSVQYDNVYIGPTNDSTVASRDYDGSTGPGVTSALTSAGVVAPDWTQVAKVLVIDVTNIPASTTFF
jgi:hypothetical protein